MVTFQATLRQQDGHISGYVQTTGWDNQDRSHVSRYIRHFRDTATISIPPSHVAMVSVVNLHTLTLDDSLYEGCNATGVALLKAKVTNDSVTSRTLWSACGARPDVVLLDDVSQFRVTYWGVSGVFFTGIRVLFTFHPVLVSL